VCLSRSPVARSHIPAPHWRRRGVNSERHPLSSNDLHVKPFLASVSAPSQRGGGLRSDECTSGRDTRRRPYIHTYIHAVHNPPRKWQACMDLCLPLPLPPASHHSRSACSVVPPFFFSLIFFFFFVVIIIKFSLSSSRAQMRGCISICNRERASQFRRRRSGVVQVSSGDALDVKHPTWAEYIHAWN